VAGRLGASGIDPANAQAADALVEVASDLVAVQLPHASSLTSGTGDVPIKSATDTFAPFVGEWWHHGLTLRVLPDGRASASWRIYRWCGPGVPQPCDSMSSSMIVEGGRASIVFQSVNSGAHMANGTVTSSSDRTTLPTGPVTMVLRPYGMADLDSIGNFITNVCGPQFSNLAPPEVQNAMPCGA
jgi:hypothetical protein